jgi:hypothetical protein
MGSTPAERRKESGRSGCFERVQPFPANHFSQFAQPMVGALQRI